MTARRNRETSHYFSSSTSIGEYFAAHRVFGSAPRVALDLLAREVIQRRYEQGHYFFRTGDSASHVFAIVSGSAVLAEDDDSGRDYVLYTLSAGDLFGLAAAILGIPRTRSAKALLDTNVLLINRETFQSLQQSFPEFARSVTFELCRLLCHSEETAGRLALRSVKSRLTRLLLGAGAQQAEQRFSSHHELALRIGCSRETITRVLGRLERAGIISAGRGHVRILGRGKLEFLANTPDWTAEERPRRVRNSGH